MRLIYSLSALLLLYLSLLGLSAVLKLSIPSILSLNLKPVVTSLLTAAITTLLASIFGIPLAYYLSNLREPYKTVVEGVIITPIILPPIASGLLLLSILSPSGFLGAVTDALGFRLTMNFAGIILAQLAVASPFLILSAKAGFDSIDRRLEYASRLMGKSELKTFLRVSIPLAKKSIVAGIMMCYVRSFGEFGATFMLAYHPRTLPIELYMSFLSGGVEKASSIAVIFWIIALIFVFLIRKGGDRFA